MINTGPVTQITGGWGRLNVLTKIVVDYAEEAAWAVITDYDNLDRYMPNLKSRAVGGQGGKLLVEQTATSSMIPIMSFHLTLEFVRESRNRLCFRRVAGNLPRFEGTWCVMPASPGTLIEYQLYVEHTWPVPGPLLTGAVRHDVSRIMPSIAAELSRQCGAA